MTGKTRLLLLASVAFAAIAWLIEAGDGPAYVGQALASGEAAPLPPPQVPVAEVVTRVLAPSSEFTGVVAAARSVELRPRVGGVIETVSVPEGELVERGQLLFQIDPRPFEVALQSAEAQLRRATVLFDQAKVDLERSQRLAPKGAIPEKALDDDVARKHEREAQVEEAKAVVAAARLDLSYTRVTAPISGRVDRVLVTEGNLVAGTPGTATLLTTIVSVDPAHVYFDIDEATYLGFRPEGAAVASPASVAVGLTGEDGFPHAGALDFLGNRVDRGTGTIKARAVLANPEGRLTPGLFARVKLATSAPRETVLIDDQAVGTDQGRRYVLVLAAGDMVEYRPVELGAMAEGLRVVEHGLNGGEEIIIKGLVRPGMQVTPNRIAMTPVAATVDGSSLEARR